MSAQLVHHRLRFVFAGDVIDADAGASVAEGQCNRAANAGACPGDDRFLTFEQLAIFSFGNDWLWQITKSLRVRHFRFRTTRCFGWHGWHWDSFFGFADSS